MPRVDEVAGGEDVAVGHDVRFSIGGRWGVRGPRAPCPIGIALSIGGGRHWGASEINGLGLRNCGEEQNVTASDGGGGAEGAVLHLAWLGRKGQTVVEDEGGRRTKKSVGTRRVAPGPLAVGLYSTMVLYCSSSLWSGRRRITL